MDTEKAQKGVSRLKGTLHEVQAHTLHWYRQGRLDEFGRRGGQRLGQYVWNMCGKDGETFPELFYTESEQTALYLIHEEFNKQSS